jgi:16S rRNA (uracil1498-N3)-methyltransferase
VATAGEGRGAGPERAFCDPLPASGTVRLSVEEGRHLVRVRRVRPGDAVVLFDGRGRNVLGRLLDDRAGKDEGPAIALEGDVPAREPRRDVAVAVAFPGAGRADDLVFALAELGVDLLVPLETARAEGDAKELLARRIGRFTKIAREAAKVNGRAHLLRIGAACALADLLSRARPEASEAAAPPSGRRPAERYAPVLLDTDPALPALPAALSAAASPLLLVGPEGGFTDEEVRACRGAGVPGASLGTCALRTEIAAVAAAAVALTVS